ncbi:MAG TPA: Gfo/Idh/MocA family oxidoreductase [Chloroflexota bacterium]|nr:Gfo/Idh/MocA family oxidoreductase [Chloroflexota bacterium]
MTTTARPLRWGILGTAKIARRAFVPGVRNGAEGEIVVVASRDAQRAAEYAAELSIPQSHGSYEALLEDEEVDAVYIPLPNGMHAAWTERAARAGKHVLCEKPAARRRADAERMAAACRQAGVILMEAFMYRHHPQHARALQLIREGAIGEPVFVRGSFCFTFSPERRAEGDHRLEPEQEGGGLMDVGCYAVNAARFLFAAEPVEVSAQQRVDPQFGVDTAFAGVLRFPGDRLAVIDGSFDVSGTQRYEVAGPKGVLQVEKAYLPGPGATQIVVAAGGKRDVIEVDGADQYAHQADLFARSVRAGKLEAPAEDGVLQAAVIEALYESAETGRAVKL